MIVALCVLVLVGTSGAFHTGAPDNACDRMIPNHNPSSPQKGRSPYTLTLAKTHYGPGESITGTLTAEQGSTFMGFLIQPRRANGSFNTIGRFSVRSADMKTTCGAGKEGLTHTDNTLKSSISFTWMAPDQDAGDVVFTYTVVKDYADYWVKLTAPALAFHGHAGVIG